MTRMSGFVAVVMLLALPCSAMMYIDEGFEDATPLTNLNYPIADDATSPSVSLLATYQGVNYRSDGSSTEPIVVMANTGTVSTASAYNGLQSLQLASGQSVGSVSSTPSYAHANQNWLNVLQFAVGVSTDTLALPVGTQVGHFATYWSTDSDDAAIELTYQVNLVRNSSNGIDVVVQQGSAVVGTLKDASNDRGKWAVVTLVAQKDTSNPNNWECWDPLTATYKGPQPDGNSTFPPGGAYATLTNGMNLFVNSNTVSNLLSAAALGNGWCNPDANNTYLKNWTIAAENGGTLFVDELSWTHGRFQGGQAGGALNQDAAARMIDFVPELAPPPPSNSARDWEIYY